jgi:regulator of RNase E activity RraA
VRSGDLVVGDGSGVVRIPAEVVELGQGYAHDDEPAAAELRKGPTFGAAMAKFQRL